MAPPIVPALILKFFSSRWRHGRKKAHGTDALFAALASVLRLAGGAFLVVLALIQIGILRYAFLRIGISSRAAMFLLLASLIGSYINIPIAELPERDVQSGVEVSFFGMQYVVPTVGAVIPGLLSLYLLFKNRMWLNGLIATAVITAIVHVLA
jgi:uncharacterized membrane protein